MRAGRRGDGVARRVEPPGCDAAVHEPALASIDGLYLRDGTPYTIQNWAPGRAIHTERPRESVTHAVSPRTATSFRRRPSAEPGTGHAASILRVFKPKRFNSDRSQTQSEPDATTMPRGSQGVEYQP